MIETLSAPASSTAWASATERIPPPIVNGMNSSSAARRASATTVGALIGGGRDVEQHDLIGAGGVVASGQLNRIAGITQIEKPDAFDDAAPIDVEAGDDALVVHGLRRPTRSAVERRLPLADLKAPFVQRLADDHAGQVDLAQRRQGPEIGQRGNAPRVDERARARRAATRSTSSRSGPLSIPSRSMLE